jgi:hypothetical protein
MFKASCRFCPASFWTADPLSFPTAIHHIQTNAIEIATSCSWEFLLLMIITRCLRRLISS